MSSRNEQTAKQLHEPQFRKRNATKADVRVERRNGILVLVKDYSSSNPLLRYTYGRYTLQREARAYACLAGITGIPRFLGFNGKDVLEVEYIHGKPLSKFKPGEVPTSVFAKLDHILVLMHKQGIANGDLHRSNIILTDDGDVYVVDFASAVWTNNLMRPGILFRFFRGLDHHAAARMRARYLKLTKPRARGVFGLFYYLGKVFKSFKKKLKFR